MVDELSETTGVFALFKEFVRDGARTFEPEFFFIHKTPTVCALIRCYNDGFVVNSAFFSRESVADQWVDADFDEPSDSDQYHLLCEHFYGFFIALQQLAADMQTFSHTIAPGAFRSFGFDKLVNTTGVPIRVFSGY